MKTAHTWKHTVGGGAPRVSVESGDDNGLKVRVGDGNFAWVTDEEWEDLTRAVRKERRRSLISFDGLAVVGSVILAAVLLWMWKKWS